MVLHNITEIFIIMFPFWFDALKCCDFGFVSCANNSSSETQIYPSPNIHGSVSATLSVSASSPRPAGSSPRHSFRRSRHRCCPVFRAHHAHFHFMLIPFLFCTVVYSSNLYLTSFLSESQIAAKLLSQDEFDGCGETYPFSKTFSNFVPKKK